MKIGRRFWPAASSASPSRGRIPTRRSLAAAFALLISITVATPGELLAATPTPTPPPTVEPTPSPLLAASDLCAAPGPTFTPWPSPAPTSTAWPTPEPTPVPCPTPVPTPDPTPLPTPKPTPKAPASIRLYRSDGFRYQNPNYSACTATAVMDMLNFISLGHRGGTGFKWSRSRSSSKRDRILAWERTHDTMAGGSGSDPHGWRNALNYYGWGKSALYAGSRVYDDFSYTSYRSAMKAAVRAMISKRKPVAMLAWAGRHAVMITGYYGLSGDPFAKDSAGKYRNTFTVGGFYLSDPLAESGRRNVRVSYASLGGSSRLKVRFRPYRETDSPYDDPYTSGRRSSRSEWYGKWVLILPVR